MQNKEELKSLLQEITSLSKDVVFDMENLYNLLPTIDENYQLQVDTSHVKMNNNDFLQEIKTITEETKKLSLISFIKTLIKDTASQGIDSLNITSEKIINSGHIWSPDYILQQLCNMGFKCIELNTENINISWS